MPCQNFSFNAKFQHFPLFHLFLPKSDVKHQKKKKKKEELSFIQLGEAGVKWKGKPVGSPKLSSPLLLGKAALPALIPVCV